MKIVQFCVSKDGLKFEMTGVISIVYKYVSDWVSFKNFSTSKIRRRLGCIWSVFNLLFFLLTHSSEVKRWLLIAASVAGEPDREASVCLIYCPSIFWISVDVLPFMCIAKDVLQVIELILTLMMSIMMLNAVLSDSAFAHLVSLGIVPCRAVPREGWCLWFLSLPAEDQPQSEPYCLYWT